MKNKIHTKAQKRNERSKRQPRTSKEVARAISEICTIDEMERIFNFLKALSGTSSYGVFNTYGNPRYRITMDLNYDLKSNIVSGTFNKLNKNININNDMISLMLDLDTEIVCTKLATGDRYSLL